MRVRELKRIGRSVIRIRIRQASPTLVPEWLLRSAWTHAEHALLLNAVIDANGRQSRFLV